MHIVMGSDAGAFRHGYNHRELELMVEYGALTACICSEFVLTTVSTNNRDAVESRVAGGDIARRGVGE